MKSYVVFSDIHGDRYSLSKLKEKTNFLNGAFFAGDGISILQNFTDKEWYFVRGNCDFSGKEEIVEEIEGVRIFLTHGHLYGVKEGYLRILMRAKELDCKVVIFGHTHIPQIFEEEGILFINPGSCSYYSAKKTYATLFISNGTASAVLGNIE